ncbi:MAG: hypothetical protein CL570_07890 [Alphaproteobacteria bacterium]|nr:hypothetical protein [Alphaproteobacteria bacterium]HCQ71757.1 hypothetical protein [Rhodospirillaceae bacterium]|tara:strand:- start:6367 stop:6669 length:303 start_codon:yes stop_codon:yes gene_type:complete
MNLTADYLHAARISFGEGMQTIKSNTKSFATAAFLIASVGIVPDEEASTPQSHPITSYEAYETQYPHEQPAYEEMIIRGNGMETTIQPSGLPYIYATTPR